jgi:hypothetical protein
MYTDIDVGGKHRFFLKRDCIKILKGKYFVTVFYIIYVGNWRMGIVLICQISGSQGSEYGDGCPLGFSTV